MWSAAVVHLLQGQTCTVQSLFASTSEYQVVYFLSLSLSLFKGTHNIHFSKHQKTKRCQEQISLPNVVWFKGPVLKPVLICLFFILEKQKEEYWWVTRHRCYNTWSSECTGPAFAFMSNFRCCTCTNIKICQVSSRSLKGQSPPSMCCLLWLLFSPSSILIKTLPLFLFLCRPCSGAISPPPNRNNFPWKSFFFFFCPCCLIYWGPSLRLWRRRTAYNGML